MSVAATSRLPVTPTLEEARELARDHNVIPLRHTFIDDCETPVSAFLKLRGRGPAFLLESAEQGQRFGRYSFLGFRPRAVLRFEHGRLDGDRGRRRARARRGRTRSRAVADYLVELPRRAARGPAAVRGRRGRACSATTSCARSSGCPSPNPDDVGTPDMALMVSDALVVFDHLQPPGHDHGERVRRRRRRRRRGLRAGGRR